MRKIDIIIKCIRFRILSFRFPGPPGVHVATFGGKYVRYRCTDVTTPRPPAAPAAHAKSERRRRDTGASLRFVVGDPVS